MKQIENRVEREEEERAPSKQETGKGMGDYIYSMGGFHGPCCNVNMTNQI